MFHVSTLLPYTATNSKQLLRKRHIGNDIVTIVFQEPGSLPFSPRMLRSHFQHVFIVVRAHQSHSGHTKYSVAVSRFHTVPSFGPPLPAPAVFSKGKTFSSFLLAKVIIGQYFGQRVSPVWKHEKLSVKRNSKFVSYFLILNIVRIFHYISVLLHSLIAFLNPTFILIIPSCYGK